MASSKESIIERLSNLPIRRYANALRNQVNDLTKRLDSQAYLDQYPGKSVPGLISKLYGPIALTTARRNGATGFEAFATVANPGQFVLPRNTNILIGRDAAFYWCSTNVYGYLSWTYAADPGFAAPITTLGPGDIFDTVIERNGGAIAMNNFALDGYITPTRPNISFELDLYDRKRGRSINDGKLPAETFAGGAFEFKKAPSIVRMDVDTEIEPRLYVDEVRMGANLNADQPFNAARVRAYVSLVLKGYFVYDEHRNS